MRASSPTEGLRVARGLRRFYLPCQREVARPEAVTEGLPYGGLAFEKSGMPEGSPGRTMCAPTGGWRLAAGFVFSRRATMFPTVCRGGPCPSRGTLRRRGVRRDGASRPTVGRVVAAVPDGPKRNILFVGAGFIPPAGPCAAANRADMESAPTGVAGNARLRSPGRLRPPGIGCAPTVDRRGGFHIRPGVFAAARGFRDDASIVPYRGAGNARVRGCPVEYTAKNAPAAFGPRAWRGYCWLVKRSRRFLKKPLRFS